ncbi:beta-ketoacyl [acyl carrier protein] synthase domain-containing protein [Nocardia brasiliensis]
MAAAVEPDFDPVVIAGIGVEVPGGIENVAEFWSALSTGRELLGPFPRDRGWSLPKLLGGSGVVPDSGGFLCGATEFDPEFFGIGESEARVTLDPQQWVALRVAWRALEHAGEQPGQPSGDRLGCYLGASYNEHSGQGGMTLSAVSGRIAHCLGATGPALTVDTSFSSALIALHLAAAAVRSGECDQALAGAVCVFGLPTWFSEAVEIGALSSDGHCRSFAVDATGVVWGEAAGVVLLERESAARANGHRVYGRLLASKVAHTGGGRRIMLPDGPAQERLLRDTLDAAGVAPEQIGLIEGDGAATPRADIAELAALSNVYKSGALVGSVKSNLGHTQAASGIIGLIKLLLCGANGQIAPSLHAAAEPSAPANSLRIATELQAWQPDRGVRYGAVSAFGLTGTNAHAIIEMPAVIG